MCNNQLHMLRNIWGVLPDYIIEPWHGLYGKAVAAVGMVVTEVVTELNWVAGGGGEGGREGASLFERGSGNLAGGLWRNEGPRAGGRGGAKGRVGGGGWYQTTCQTRHT
jgi:hypothetical protein